MLSAINIAVSGFRAAEDRLANAANNIANALTPNYQPTDVAQIALPEGGVATKTVQRIPPSQIPVYDPSQAQANVSSPELDAVEAKIATYDAKANLNVIGAYKKLSETLLNIIS